MNYFSAFAGRSRPLGRELVWAAVDEDDTRLTALLEGSTPAELDTGSVRELVAGRVGRLTPEAFRYFLPGFMTLTVESYNELRDFAAELVGALTEPRREDVVASFAMASQIPKEFGMPEGMLDQLRVQQLEWFDSGEPRRLFAERMAGLSTVERAAVLDFLRTMREDHREDFLAAGPGSGIVQ